MTEKSKSKEEEPKVRKKNLSWNDKNIEDAEDITPETNLLPENTSSEARVMVRNTYYIIRFIRMQMHLKSWTFEWTFDIFLNA